jgi:hypothetical protein
MAKPRTRVRKEVVCRDMKDALDVLCGPSEEVQTRYKLDVVAKAKSDAVLLFQFFRELLPDGSPSNKESLEAIKQTLYALCQASLRKDGEHSEDLIRLAYRLALNPMQEIKGDLRCIQSKRYDDKWAIRVCPSVIATLLPVAPLEPIREYRSPFMVQILDCVLRFPQDIASLQALLAPHFGLGTSPGRGVPHPSVESLPQESMIQIRQDPPRVLFCEIPVKLHPNEIYAFLTICEGLGEEVSDEEVFKHVWPGRKPLNLRSVVSKIRRSLVNTASEIPDKAARERAVQFAQTLIPPKTRGFGYRIAYPESVVIS